MDRWHRAAVRLPRAAESRILPKIISKSFAHPSQIGREREREVGRPRALESSLTGKSCAAQARRARHNSHRWRGASAKLAERGH